MATTRLVLLLVATLACAVAFANGFSGPGLAELSIKRAISPNNTCGSANGFICDPKYPGGGPCCSKHGFCGKTKAYCGGGCQWSFSNPGCLSSPQNICGGPREYICNPQAESGGPCCSARGFCGSSDAYCGKGCNPRFGSCSAATPSTSSGSPASADGQDSMMMGWIAGPIVGGVVLIAVIIGFTCYWQARKKQRAQISEKSHSLDGVTIAGSKSPFDDQLSVPRKEAYVESSVELPAEDRVTRSELAADEPVEKTYKFR